MIASEPCTMLGPDNTILELQSFCEERLNQYASASEKDVQEIEFYHGLAYRRNNNITSRNVPFKKQYFLLLNRMFMMAWRIPVAFLALVMMAFFQGLLQASIFQDVGA